MSNQTLTTKEQIEKTRTALGLLEQLDQLESEFRLIEDEYRQRHRVLIDKLYSLNPVLPELTGGQS